MSNYTCQSDFPLAQHHGKDCHRNGCTYYASATDTHPLAVDWDTVVDNLRTSPTLEALCRQLRLAYADEGEELAEHQKEFETPSVELEGIFKHFRKPIPQEGGLPDPKQQWMSSSEIANVCGANFRSGVIRKYRPEPHSHMVYYDIDEILQNLKAKSENSAAP